MREYIYDVILHTEIGERIGSAVVRIHENKVSGILTLLNRTEHFTGSVAQDGTCRLSGKLISLMREIPFEAQGSITAQDLELTLYAARGSYTLTGIRTDVRQMQQEVREETSEGREMP